MAPGLTEASCAGSGRSFTAYVFKRRGFVPPAARQLAAAEQACPDPLRSPTPLDRPEAHMRSASSQASAELEAADVLAWCGPSLCLWKEELACNEACCKCSCSDHMNLSSGSSCNWLYALEQGGIASTCKSCRTIAGPVTLCQGTLTIQSN